MVALSGQDVYVFIVGAINADVKMIGISVADIRVEPRFESERDSQLIYGEEVSVLSEHGEYLKVRGRDGLVGFVKKRLVMDSGSRKYKLNRFYDAGSMKFPFGSYVSLEDVKYYKLPQNILVPLSENGFRVTDLAMQFLAVPYLWGGTSDFGFDCSGMVQRIYRFVGKEIPRNADQQRDFTRTVEGFDEALPGDLVFFKGHVGLYLGDGKMIHANGHSASVSIDDIIHESDYQKILMSIYEKIGRVSGSL